MNFNLEKSVIKRIYFKWDFNTNLTDENEQKVTDFALVENKFQKLTKRTAEKFRKYLKITIKFKIN